MDDIIGLIIFVIILLAGGLRRLLEKSTGRPQPVRRPRKKDYVAPPEEIKKFVQSVEKRRRAEAGAAEKIPAVSARKPAKGAPQKAVPRQEWVADAVSQPDMPTRVVEDVATVPAPKVAPQLVKPKMDLKQAVMWSEILGPPVALRGMRRGLRTVKRGAQR